MTAVLVVAGIAVVVVAAVRTALAPDDLTRLHYLAPTTALGVPLIGVGIALTTGWTWTTATVALAVVLLALTGPPLSAAIAGASAEQEEDA